MKSILTELNKFLTTDQICENVSMIEHTSFKAGGNVSILLLPKSSQELLRCVLLCKNEKARYVVIGNGSNILFRDSFYEGVVIKTSSCFNEIGVSENIVTADAGALLSSIGQKALENSLSGFEFACGIPGTVGGAVIMNAGAYEQEMKDVVKKIHCIDNLGNIKEYSKKEAKFAYRASKFQVSNEVITSVEIELGRGGADIISSKMKEFNKKRNARQPINVPSAGSTFKRPVGYFAGKLIEDAGLKGTRIGGACISEMHGGFIVNDQDATARDIIELIDLVQKTVYERFGISLETEVKII